MSNTQRKAPTALPARAEVDIHSLPSRNLTTMDETIVLHRAQLKSQLLHYRNIVTAIIRDFDALGPAEIHAAIRDLGEELLQISLPFHPESTEEREENLFGLALTMVRASASNQVTALELRDAANVMRYEQRLIELFRESS